jgi:hypothetical protein
MAYAFDTSGHAQRLRDDGISAAQAEAHAEAARDVVMAELVTKTDLNTALDHLALQLITGCWNTVEQPRCMGARSKRTM